MRTRTIFAAMSAAFPLVLATGATLMLTGCTLTTPAQAQTQTAMVGKAGEVSFRRADNEAVIATVHPGIFEATWQLRGATFNKNAGKAIINAPTAGAQITVTSKVEKDGKRLRLTYTLTPDKDVKVNSTHVSVDLAVGDFIGGTATVGDGAGVTVPTESKNAFLTGGSGSVKLTRGAKSIEISCPTGQPIIVQDNRVFGGATLEVRVGPQTPEGSVWPAGKTETITLVVDTGEEAAIVQEEPITLVAGPDWATLDTKQDVEPGSALDFSKLWNDAPAGKYGHVIARPDGHFGFEKRDKPQRFYGVNLCFTANYLEKDEADRLADRLMRIGYNTVRIHHYERDLLVPMAANSYTLSPEQLDKLDYLIAALIKRGIYIKTDLYVSRPVKESEMGVEGGMDEFKAAVLVSKPAMDNWKSFVRVLLTHVNPYTGKAYKDEPALAFLSVINEPALTNHFGRFTGKLRALYEAEWTNWLKARYGTDDKVKAVWGDGSLSTPLPRSIEDNRRGRDVGAFLTFIHRRGFAEMKAFLRKDIGTKALLTDLNGWSETPAYMAARTDLDWVDNHFYWDHPHFLERDWNLPSEGGSGGRGAVETAGAGPNFLAMTRLYGKPFSVSEYNYSAPNRYRAEGGLLMGAASAIQDWDAVWRFAYSHSREGVINPTALDYFDMASDPAGQAGERAALLLFLRGDLKPASTSLSLVRKETALTTDPQASAARGFSELTLVSKVGTRVEKPNTPLPPLAKGEVRLTDGDSASALNALRAHNSLPPANRTDLTKPRRESETGELFVDGEAGTLKIDTARTVGGVAPTNGTVEAGALTAKVMGTRAAIWASSLDDKPVAQSSRILLVHLTDVQNNNMRYSSPDRRVLEAWGGLPHIVRKGSASVTLRHATPDKLKVWRLDTSGKRIAEVPVKVANGAAQFDLTTESADGGATLYYEVVVP